MNTIIISSWKIMAALGLSVLLASCASYSKSPEDQAAYHVSEAKEAILKGDNLAANMVVAVNQIDAALACPTGDVKIKELFTKYPKGRDYYRAYLEKLIVGVSSAFQAREVFEKLSTIKLADILLEDQVHDLFSNLSKTVVEGNTTGAVPFVLGDKIDVFPELGSPIHQRIIIDRSIKKLQDSESQNRQVAALMEYVQRVGVDSEEGKRIAALLPTMNIRRSEIEATSKVFPEFSLARKEEIASCVFVRIKNVDRLLSEDIFHALQNGVHEIEWVQSDGPKITTLIIEQVRNDEKTLPNLSQTTIYSWGEVNFRDAILLMPKHASYLYEVVSGGAEIEYGFVISAVLDGKTIHDETIRGKVRGEYHRCQNARIQNVFGGVSSAGFVANGDMQQRCADIGSKSIEDLRKEVLSKLVDGVLKIPTIQAALEK